MNTPIENIRQELQMLGNAETAAASRRFFKETIETYGVKNAEVHRLAKAHFKDMSDKSKANILALCEHLWQSGYMEEALIACDWSFFVRKQFEPVDFEIFEKWIDCYVSNWAACDTFCNHTVGAFIERYPAFLDRLKNWALSPNRWLRRAAAVSLIIPAKEGRFLPEILEIAGILLRDRDDLVQKGYGWMLKEATKLHREAVFNFVMHHKAEMPRTALRYAIEKMPAAMKKAAMEKAH